MEDLVSGPTPASDRDMSTMTRNDLCFGEGPSAEFWVFALHAPPSEARLPGVQTECSDGSLKRRRLGCDGIHVTST